MCHGAPLEVTSEYQKLEDMSFYSIDEAGVPANGREEDYDVEIPWVVKFQQHSPPRAQGQAHST